MFFFLLFFCERNHFTWVSLCNGIKAKETRRKICAHTYRKGRRVNYAFNGNMSFTVERVNNKKMKNAIIEWNILISYSFYGHFIISRRRRRRWPSVTDHLCRMNWGYMSNGKDFWRTSKVWVKVMICRNTTNAFTTIKIWNKLPHKRTPSSIQSHTHTSHTRNMRISCEHVMHVDVECLHTSVSPKWWISWCDYNGPTKKWIACFQCSQINFHRNTHSIDALKRPVQYCIFIPIYCNLISVIICIYCECVWLFGVASHFFMICTSHVLWWPFMTIEKCRKGRERIGGAHQDIIARKRP